MSLFVSVMAQALKSKDRSICDLPSVTGPCRGSFERFFYNKESGECEKFIYGGCRGNKNNFKSKKECEKQCKKDRSICDLPSVTGPCRGSFERFFYNKESGECEKFIYGGCRGNKNNFKSKKECEKQCKKD